MKKAEKKVKAVRVNKAKQELADYKASVVNYLNRVRTRQSVEHSRTPASAIREGKTLPASILVGELTSIVRTASKLDKIVVLGVNGDMLVVLLEDKVPQIPYSLW